MECPQCRSIVAVAGNDPSSLPTVFFINGLIEGYEILKKAESNEIACQSCSSDAKASSFCHTCSMFICVTCTNAHETMKAFSGHETTPISEMKKGTLIRLPTKKSPVSTCKKHEGELQRLYCFKCKKLICQFCALVDHAGHKFDFVKAVADTFKEEILSSLVPLHETHARFTTAIAKVEGSKKEIRDQGEDIALTISQSFEELHVILNNREQVLLQQAREVVGRKVGVLDRQQEEIQLAVATLNSLVGFIERTMENASDEEFISMKQQMNSRVKQLFRKYQDVKLSPNEVADTFMKVPLPTSLAELCKKTFIADGPGLKSATVDQVSKFTVCTYDTHDQPPPVQQNVSAELKSLVDGSVLQAIVVRQTPSTYKLSYTPTTRGRYQLTIRVNDIEIGTFEVFVQHPPTQLSTPVRAIAGVKPLYIAVGDKGELFVTEHWDGQYTVLSTQGQRLLNVGAKGKPPFGDGWPTGIATDGKGNVYIASGHKLQKFNRYGQLVKSVGKKGVNVGEFHWSRGVKYHNHQVYVCDKDNGRIQVFDSSLNFVRAFGTQGDGPGQLKKPRDIDFDANGKVYVVDPWKNRVLVFSEDGQYLKQFDARGEGELRSPTGLCVSGDYVYITEWANHCVLVFHTSGEFVHSFGTEGSGSGQLLDPSGITVDKDGFVFVCDTSNSRIQVF